MQHRHLINDKSFNLAAKGTIGLTALFLLAFLFGSARLAIFLSNYLIPLAALETTLVIAWFWQLSLQDKTSEKTLRLFMIGFALWTIAELVWLFFISAGLDPYPSVADIFWIAGYFPFFFALRANLENVSVRPTEGIRWVTGGLIYIGLLGLIYLIVIPIVLDFESGRWLESIVNVAYPLLDMVILAEIITLYFLFGKGRFSLPWLLISVGFVIMAMSDLGYSYADWNGLYDAEQGNLVSRLIDAGYLINYLIIVLGFYAYWLIINALTDTTKTAPPEYLSVQNGVPNTVLVAIVDQGNQLLDISENFLEQLDEKSKDACLKRKIGDVLGQPAEIEQIINTIRTQGKIASAPLSIQVSSREKINVWVSGIPVYENNIYAGVNLAFKIYIKDAEPAEGLSEYHNSIAAYVLQKTESELPDFAGILLHYASESIQCLAKLLSEYKGELVTATFYKALQNNIPDSIQVSPEGIQVTEKLPVNELADSLRPLLKKIQSIVKQQVSDTTVSNAIQKVEQRLDPLTLAITQDYNLR